MCYSLNSASESNITQTMTNNIPPKPLFLFPFYFCEKQNLPKASFFKFIYLNLLKYDLLVKLMSGSMKQSAMLKASKYRASFVSVQLKFN